MPSEVLKKGMVGLTFDRFLAFSGVEAFPSQYEKLRQWIVPRGEVRFLEVPATSDGDELKGADKSRKDLVWDVERGDLFPMWREGESERVYFTDETGDKEALEPVAWEEWRGWGKEETGSAVTERPTGMMVPCEREGDTLELDETAVVTVQEGAASELQWIGFEFDCIIEAGRVGTVGRTEDIPVPLEVVDVGPRVTGVLPGEDAVSVVEDALIEEVVAPAIHDVLTVENDDMPASEACEVVPEENGGESAEEDWELEGNTE